MVSSFRRSSPVALVLVLVIGALSACGLFSETDEAEAGETVTIEHKFGQTEVPENPEKVVTVGWNDQDFVLALGVVPTLTRAWFDEYNDFPWVQAATDGAGVETMGGDGINFDAIGAEDPDVIIAIYESIDERTYNRLSEIAPTVVQSDEYADEETPWDVQMLTTGRALGMEERARALVDEVEAAIDEAVAAHPEFAGTVLVEDYGPTSGGHYLIGADDPRRALFDALGFEAQDTVGDLSAEKLTLLEEDVLFVNGALEADMMKSPAFARLDVVQDGRTLYTPFDSALSGALSYSGPEALLYALDVLVPELAAAIDGNSVGDVDVPEE